MSFSIKELMSLPSTHDPDPDNPSIGFTGRLDQQKLIERAERLKREQWERRTPEFDELRRIEQQVKRGENIE